MASRNLTAIIVIVAIVVVGVVLYVWWTSQTPPPEVKDIVETAMDAGSFTTLLDALDAANLTDTLKGEGPFTVFAPTDTAFNELPTGLLDELLANKTRLTEVLTYHVVSGTYMEADLAGLTSLTTIQGSDLTITSDGGIMIDGATVTQADVEASNGVIQVIDRVLIPAGVLDIVQTADSYGTFTTLIAALDAANLTDVLKGAGPFTVFAPTDDAFAALPGGVLDDLLANTTALTEVLTYHVASGRYSAADVVSMGSITTLQGGVLTVNTTEGVKIDGAKVVKADIAASNGIIHVIDKVLMPEGVMDIVQTADYHGSFTTLLTALEAANLTDTLKGEGPFTVFAPTDAAFAALPEGVLDDLLANETALVDVLTYHVVSGKLMADEVVALGSLTTLQGGELKITTNGDVLIDSAKIILTDIEARNGVIHAIDKVLIPGGILDMVQTAEYHGSFNTLLTALEAANLTSTLKGGGPFTLFAPTDEAFDKLPDGVLPGLLANVTALTDVLTYHVASGRLFVADLVSMGSITTLQGGILTVGTDGGITINGANIIQADIVASNGVIQVIDEVLLP